MQSNNQHAPRYCYVDNTKIEGSSKVGGIVGEIRDGPIYGNIVNAEITATAHTAGGIVGYMENSTMTAATNIIRMYNNGVAGATITAPTKVGGLVGDIAKDLNTEAQFFYNNYVHAYLKCEDSENVSMGIGGSKENNDTITNTYIYRYSQINNEYMSENLDTYTDEQFVNADDLKQETTYRNKFGWGAEFTYTSLANNKYPIPRNVTGQDGIDLPVDPEINGINVLDSEEHEEDEKVNSNEDNTAGGVVNGLQTNENGQNEQGVPEGAVELPEITVYPISAYEINIDFSTIPENTYFTYSINGQEVETKELDRRTYTFAYNYQDTIEIKLINQGEVSNQAGEVTKQEEAISQETLTTNQEKTIIIEPQDVISKISLKGDMYAYLVGNTIYQGDNAIEGEYVNLYKGKALTKDGYVYDIETQTIQKIEEAEKVTETVDDEEKETTETTANEETISPIATSLEETAKSQNSYTYNGNQIDVYGTYSTINGNVKAQIYTIKNGRLSAITNSLDWKIGNIITDNYNGKEYQTVLNKEGKLVDIKEALKYPNNFLNEKIVQVAENEGAEKTEVMVYYESGKVIVFNYVTGATIYENEVENNISLFSFIAERFQNVFSDYEEKQREYEESQELIAKLEETPIEEAIEIAVSQNSQNGSNNKNNENSVGENNTWGDNNNNDNEIKTEVDNTIQTETDNNGNITNLNRPNYITVYNPETGAYEVYSESEIIEGEEEEPVSETTKIQINGLQNFYGNGKVADSNKNVNGTAIIAIVIIIVLVLLICLRIYIRSKQKRKYSK